MPLHDGTRSVGIVQDQQMATDRKRQLGHASSLDFYKQSLKLVPRTSKLLSGAELATDIKSASDWSHTASSYHLASTRICGDAGCFIDSKKTVASYTHFFVGRRQRHEADPVPGGARDLGHGRGGVLEGL